VTTVTTTAAAMKIQRTIPGGLSEAGSTYRQIAMI
jgi:hypothetical protein